MKIDSPTFLSETTFISASVQFSSGSQKFGNTTDDQHQFTGSLKIGGNSFFREIGSGHQVYIDSDAGGVAQIGTNTYTPLSIRANGNQAIYISQGAVVSMGTTNVGNLTSTGTIVSTGANGLISGSSTSTGSFGRINLASSNPVIGNNGVIIRGGSGSTGVNFRVRNGYGNDTFRVHGHGGLAIGGAFGDSLGSLIHLRYISGLVGGNGEYLKMEDNSNYSGSIGLGSNGTLRLIPQGSTVRVMGAGSSAGNLTVDGKVHIGASSTPTNHLEVEGTIYASGNISGSATSTGSFGSVILKSGYPSGTNTSTLDIYSTNSYTRYHSIGYYGYIDAVLGQYL